MKILLLTPHHDPLRERLISARTFNNRAAWQFLRAL